MSKFTIGSDPEFFIKRRNKLVSAVPIIPGTKHDPDVTESGAMLQHDNVAVEFATPVANSKEEFVDAIGIAMKEVRAALPKGHKIEAIPSAKFNKNELQTEEAQKFGCEPDFNCWSVSMNPEPDQSDPRFRSAGGHIHVGFVKDSGNDFLLDFDGKLLMTKMMDTFHGIISVLLDNSKAAIARRVLYGKAGCHRPKDYGIEYRTLSNFWLKSPQLVMLMHHLTEDCLSIIRSGKAEDLINDIGGDNIQEIINEGKVSEAQDVLDIHLVDYLSEDSGIFLNDCLEKMETFDMKKEWAAY